MKKNSVLLSAYACAPGIGSEYEVGWQWSIASAKYFDTWVLTKADNKRQIEKWKENNCFPDSLHFVYVDIPRWALKVQGRLGVLVKYESWQLKIMKKLSYYKENVIFFLFNM